MSEMEPWKWYIRSLYWVITTVSTTGFGDITPLNANETVLSIGAIFCGAFVLSIILSHFTSGTASLSKSAREYLYQVNLLTVRIHTESMRTLKFKGFTGPAVLDSCRNIWGTLE
jgi:hypothetical protein